jgi:2-amino-4-hydroxy-6-hydroxymethyldihydropteridine diphosphokinase
MHNNDLIIPHPELHKRMFTLIPLAEVSPDFVHPVYKKPVSVLLNECDDPLKVHKSG